MTLTDAEVDTLIGWARDVFLDTEKSWTLADDRLLDKITQEQRYRQRRKAHFDRIRSRAISTN